MNGSLSGLFDATRGPVRRPIPGGGRLHLDRPLPFLCIYRRPPGRPDPGTGELISGQGAYLLVSGDAPSDHADEEVVRLIRAVARPQAAAMGESLVLEVWSAPGPGRVRETDPESLRPRFRIATSGDPRVEATVEELARALARIRLEGHEAEVTVERSPRSSAPGLPPIPTTAKAGEAGEEDAAGRIHVLGLEVAPVYRDAETGELLPFLLLELRRELTDALKRALFAFSGPTRLEDPHWQALGPSRIEPVAAQVDRRLGEIDGSFDFLLQVTPLNAREAWEAFRESGFERAPEFRYRPFRADPELLKRKLFELPVEEVEDPTLTRLFRDKQEELDRRITMLRDRGTRQFFFGSLQLYGEVEHGLLELARDILDRLPPSAEEPGEVPAEEGDDGAPVGPATDVELADAAARELAAYREAWEFVPEAVTVRDDVPPGLIVSHGRLLIGRGTTVPRDRVEPLLHHEVGTHVLTYYNGEVQPLEMLRYGSAGYESLQEGLAVLSEYLAGGLTVGRLRVLAARVLAAHCLIEEASFVDVFRLLVREHDFEPSVAYTIAMRTFRGGGLIKDVVYLRGLRELTGYLREGGEVASLFVGKIALGDLPALQELRRRGILRTPPLRPRVLADPECEARLLRLREGLTLVDILERRSEAEAAKEDAAAEEAAREEMAEKTGVRGDAEAAKGGGAATREARAEEAERTEAGGSP